MGEARGLVGGARGLVGGARGLVGGARGLVGGDRGLIAVLGMPTVSVPIIAFASHMSLHSLSLLLSHVTTYVPMSLLLSHVTTYVHTIVTAFVTSHYIRTYHCHCFCHMSVHTYHCHCFCHMSLHTYIPLSLLLSHVSTYVHTIVTAFVTCHYLTLPGPYLLLHTYLLSSLSHTSYHLYHYCLSPLSLFLPRVTTLCHSSSTLHQANSTVAEEVHAPRWLHRFIIGRKGQNLREITENLPKLHLEFNADKDAIFLEGPQAEVLQAKSKLEDFTKDLVRGRGRDGSLTQSLCTTAHNGGLSGPDLTVIWLFSGRSDPNATHTYTYTVIITK